MMKRPAGILWMVSFAALGCGAVEAPAKEQATATVAATPAPVTHNGTVLASVTLEEGHVLQFVEFAPGMTGYVESGQNNLHQRVMTAQLEALSLPELYRHFAGPTASVPSTIVAAHERVQAQPQGETAAPTVLPAQKTSGGEGPHFYNDGEQTWFRNTFCNGAQNCEQAWDWAVVTSHWSIGNGSGVAMVGSECTTNATYSADYWSCACVTPFCIGGQQCLWGLFWSAIVVPGHWVSMGVNGNGGSHYIQWNLSGAGGGTQVSLAASYS
jgi:hypothetical protein